MTAPGLHVDGYSGDMMQRKGIVTINLILAIKRSTMS